MIDPARGAQVAHHALVSQNLLRAANDGYDVSTLIECGADPMASGAWPIFSLVRYPSRGSWHESGHSLQLQQAAARATSQSLAVAVSRRRHQHGIRRTMLCSVETFSPCNIPSLYF